MKAMPLLAMLLALTLVWPVLAQGGELARSCRSRADWGQEFFDFYLFHEAKLDRAAGCDCVDGRLREALSEESYRFFTTIYDFRTDLGNRTGRVVAPGYVPPELAEAVGLPVEEVRSRYTEMNGSALIRRIAKECRDEVKGEVERAVSASKESDRRTASRPSMPANARALEKLLVGEWNSPGRYRSNGDLEQFPWTFAFVKDGTYTEMTRLHEKDTFPVVSSGTWELVDGTIRRMQLTGFLGPTPPTPQLPLVVKGVDASRLVLSVAGKADRLFHRGDGVPNLPAFD